jgi:type VI secretion system protein ImpG
MDPRLLQLYTQELHHVKDMGAEFGRRFPKIARRLGMGTTEVDDPYVERLLEGFAFLAARVQLRLQEEFPQFTEHLIELLYPSLRASRPSMGVIQLNPEWMDGSLKQGIPVPRHSIFSQQISPDFAPCKFRTAHEVTMWPLKIDSVTYSAQSQRASHQQQHRQEATKLNSNKQRASLLIELEANTEIPLRSLNLDHLDFYISAQDQTALRLAQSIAFNATRIQVLTGTGWTALKNQQGAILPEMLGFDDSQALLPEVAENFSAFRLLQEFYGLPQRFLFFRIQGLRLAVQKAEGQKLQILIGLNALDPDLARSVSTDSLALHCTPVVNLFEHRCDRLNMDSALHEFQVLPDRVHPLDYEIHSVLSIQAYGPQVEGAMSIPALYKPQLEGAEDEPGYVLRRQATLPSERRVLNGGRSRYLGSDTYVALSWPDYRLRAERGLKQLGVRTLCSNRDLPLLLPVGQGVTDLITTEVLPLKSVRFLAGPTTPHTPVGNGRSSWQLIQHFSLNLLGLIQSDGAPALRQLLKLYADPEDSAQLQWVDAVKSIQAEPCIHAVTRMGRRCAARGLHIQLEVDSLQLQGIGSGLFMLVLTQVLARHVSVNSFVKCSMTARPGGVTLHSVPMAGSRPLL